MKADTRKIEERSGQFWIVDDDGRAAGPFASCADAWRYYDDTTPQRRHDLGRHPRSVHHRRRRQKRAA